MTKMSPFKKIHEIFSTWNFPDLLYIYIYIYMNRKLIYCNIAFLSVYIYYDIFNYKEFAALLHNLCQDRSLWE